MITYSEAINIIHKQNKILPTEEIHTSEIINRICAEDILAPMAIQPFDNSAMDGFCMKAEDIANASINSPIKLMLLGKIAAGEAPPKQKTPKGACWEIMTGAPLSHDCNSVVPVENTTHQNGNVVFTSPSPIGNHIRLAGEDFKTGERVIKKGTTLGSEHILALATLGINKVKVIRKIKVAIITTGKEVINNLTDKLKAGQIYNSTAPYMISSLNELGAEVKYFTNLPDNPEEFPQIINNIEHWKADIIISTGAVSMGRHDFIPNSLKNIGAEILFHKIFIRPGKPNLFAKTVNGTFFFGLPGNPVATAVGLRFFIEPLIKTMQNLPPEKPIKAKLITKITGKEDFRIFLKAKIKPNTKGEMEVNILSKQQSFMVSPFTKMNCWAIKPEGKSNIKSGNIIDVYPLFSNYWKELQCK